MGKNIQVALMFASWLTSKLSILGLWKRFVWGCLDVDGLVLKRPKAPSGIAFRGGEKTLKGLKLLSKICLLFGKFAKKRFLQI